MFINEKMSNIKIVIITLSIFNILNKNIINFYF